MKQGKNLFLVIFIIVMLIVVVFFAVQNSQEVAINAMGLNEPLRAPLAMIVLSGIAMGTLVTMISLTPSLMRNSYQIKQLTKNLGKTNADLEGTRGDLQKVRDEHGNLLTDYQTLTQSFEELNSEYHHLRDDHHETASRLEQIKSENESINAQYDDLNLKYEEVKAQSAKLASLVSSFESAKPAEEPPQDAETEELPLLEEEELDFDAEEGLSMPDFVQTEPEEVANENSAPPSEVVGAASSKKGFWNNININKFFPKKQG